MPGIKNFKGKVVVVTGAGSGIGRATAVAFAFEGAKVVLSDISEERLTEVRKEIEKKGTGILVHKTDVSDRSQVKALADFVMNEYGRIDILHNNAGVAVGSPVENTSIEDWKWIFGINFWGVVYGIDSFLPYMISQRSGHIVNTASLFGLIGVLCSRSVLCNQIRRCRFERGIESRGKTLWYRSVGNMSRTHKYEYCLRRQDVSS